MDFAFKQFSVHVRLLCQASPPTGRCLSQVFLKNAATQEKLVYATSWWAKDDMDRYIKETKAPIWVNLMAKRAELYRSIERIYLGDNEQLAKAFGNAVSVLRSCVMLVL
jgi:hypothetical protein